MRKDIERPKVKGVHLAVAKNEEEEWSVYIINNTEEELDDTLVVSKGYGENKNEQVQTSTLRHYIGTVKAKDTEPIERIDPDLFHLTHEFWITFYISGKIYDKKFIFTSGSLTKENLSYIKELEKQGVLHS